jgi:oxygen-dependent protoporphyrinogen oxidase
VIVKRVLVIGGGIAGLATAHWIAERSRAAGWSLAVRLVEAAARAGGNVHTVREDGFVVEAGPNGWLDREPAARALLQDLGLTANVVEARAAAKRRFIVRGGRLCRVPDSPPALVSSPALTPLGKLRLMLEPFAARPPAGVEETVFDFAERRVGFEAAEYLVDAAISGITAGDSRRLSVGAAFPLMVEMEREHGSLIRAMLARRKTAGPTRLVSLDRGLGLVVETLVKALGDRLVLGAAATAVAHDGRCFRVRFADGQEMVADQVVLALPAWRAAMLLPDLDLALTTTLDGIPGAGLAVVALAYRAADVLRPLDGYGYLVTRGEGRDTLGVVWESSLFDGRAPEGTVLLRAMVGGVRRPECVARTPEALEAAARSEIAPLLGVCREPLRSWVFRWPTAIPQYERGHVTRREWIRARAGRYPGLHLCGSSFDGVSFASAIASADRTAAEVLGEAIGARAAAPEPVLQETA